MSDTVITMQQVPDLFHFYRELQQVHVLVCYKGRMTADLLHAIHQIGDAQLTTDGEESGKRKRLQHILMEVLQNLFHHQQSFDAKEDPGTDIMIMLTRDNSNHYFILSGNSIENEKCPTIESRLMEINKMSAEELRQYHVQKLNQSELSLKGGAGLGLIDMARKSGNRLLYRFDRLSETHSFFTLIVEI